MNLKTKIDELADQFRFEMHGIGNIIAGKPEEVFSFILSRQTGQELLRWVAEQAIDNYDSDQGGCVFINEKWWDEFTKGHNMTTIKLDKVPELIRAVRYFLQEELDRYGSYDKFLNLSDTELRLELWQALEEVEGE